MLRPILTTLCIALAFVPASSAAEEAPALPAWLEARLEAAGVVVDPADLVVTRTVVENGHATSFEISLADLAQEDPFEGYTVAAPSVGEVLVGDLTLHLMFQLLDCPGYGATALPGGLTSVSDASWDVGLHLALGPLAGGVAVGTGADPTNPANLLLIANTDTGMTAAAGDLSITEDRIEIFGQCLLLVGTMTGTGAWVFE